MNKIKLLLIAIGFIFSLNLYAQNDFKIGINVGINYPKVRGHEYAKYNNFKVGYLFGVSIDYYLKENLSLKTNINYERKIKKLQLTYFSYTSEEIGTENFSEIYEYINIPILLKYEFGNSTFFVNGGPFFNYLLNNKIEPDFPNEDSDSYTEQKKIDFGFSLGIGTNISLNEKNDITIEIRDDLGIIDTGYVPKSVKGTVKTNAVKFILGWNLGI
ncbi:porin family protein [Psychroserpens ponticola]|uniref:Porin family protein n=1 Tax=Psychroserpens ponticola TaxID=2932268 RepID=A0ABY7RYC6_9FLAO|nr:porin family protein [Psychroserpens ponticola]WCO00705.1 porin family protein [Psychroserpens ponticola]